MRAEGADCGQLGPAVRARLAAEQAALVRALVEHAPPPAGFDPARLTLAAESLGRKRICAVARAWPGLAGALGPHFSERFAAFAATSSIPHSGGPLADGRAFARALARDARLPDAGRIESLAVDLRYSSGPSGLKPRRGPAIAVALLTTPRRLVVAVRLPWLGERWWTMPLG